MPKVGDHYIGAEILLPREDKMARVQVAALISNANGNFTDWAHTNPIYKTRTYQIEFTCKEVTELTTIIIAKLMYS